MSRILWTFILIAAVPAVVGCEQSRELLGMNKEAPDEFAVYSRAPLSMPPDYTLYPPAPGTARPQETSPREEAEKAIGDISSSPRGEAGRPAPSAINSPGIEALLRRTGGLDADRSIRSTINRETTILAEEDQSLTDMFLFWGTPNEYGTVVDPTKESKRIRQNQALGRPLTEGEVPTIERKRKALLEDIFN